MAKEIDDKNIILKMENIRKTFLGGKIIANDNVSLKLGKNEILSIVGENGSGKSTLMNILFGLYQQDSGKIFYEGNEVNMYSSGAAAKYGIGMVHQHFHLVDKFTVLDNILIGQEKIEVNESELAISKREKEKNSLLLKEWRKNLTPEQNNKFKELLKIDKKITLSIDAIAKLYNKIALNINDKEYVKKQKELIKEEKKHKSDLIHQKKESLSKSSELKKGFKIYVDLEKAKNEIKTSQTSNYGVINKKAAIKRFKNITEEYGIKLMYDQRIIDLSVGDRQKVEILKVLWTSKNIVVFDEPTATLSVSEIEEFLMLMNTLKAKGVSIIFISHKLKEVKEVADRVVVLNKGKFMGSYKNEKKLTIEKIAKLMVGADVKLSYPKRELSDEVQLELKNISARDKGTKKLYLDNVSFKAMKGEIFGLAGIEGNGQAQIIEVISGLMKPDQGKIIFNNEDITSQSVSERNQYMSHIATDRFKHAIVPLETLAFNSIFTSLNDPRFSKYRLIKVLKKGGLQTSTLWIDRTGVGEHTDNIIKKTNVEGAFAHSIPIKDLSGGNQQKFVVGRELLKKHELLLAGHPTRGLDIKAIDNIYKNIIENSEEKVTILFSLELTELLAVCDRVAVFHEGKIVKIINPRNKEDVAKLPNLMVGVN